ncbi:MAG: nucleotide exchange factor GrpE [Halanaeroarchaeum sp.]
MTEAEESSEDEQELDLVAEVTAHDEELGAAVADLQERVEAQEDEIAELTERLQRTQADFQNYKKRAKKRQRQLEERATEELVERLLDVRDDLSRALEDDSDDVESLREGIRMTRNEFDRVLDAENVVRIEPSPGDDVDPNRHEVLMRVESDQPEDTVAEVYRPGYEMAGTVLRTAQVTVSEGAPEDDEPTTGEPTETEGDGSGAEADEPADRSTDVE